MEWLKKILENANVVDGKLDIDGLMKSINSEFPKNAVPKDKYNEVSEAKKQLETDLKDRDTQLETLKKSVGDNEALKNQITSLQNENKTKDDEYKQKIKDLTINSAITLELSGKVHDIDLVSRLVDKSKVILAEDGTSTGLKEQIEALQKEKSFLFMTGEKKTPYNPGNGDQGTKSLASTIAAERNNQGSENPYAKAWEQN